MTKLSVAIITYNEEHKIAKTLEAINDIANEIIIVDSYSIDKTVEISKQYGAHVYQEKWKGFGAQKNSALEKCSGEWILMLDADEQVSTQLKEEVVKIINNPTHEVYKIRRSTVCFEKNIRYGGFGNDDVIRLWKKGKVHLGDEKVHETYITKSDVGQINKPIWHHTYISLEEYFRKFNDYTTLVATERFKKGKRASFIKLYFNPVFRFFKFYILKLGFLDGIEGFLLASLAGFYTYVKYSKLRHMYNQKD